MTRSAKIIYLILFILLILHPHVIKNHIGFIPLPYVQSLTTLVILGLAYGLYMLHKRDIDRHEEESKISARKLLGAFKYIGKVNRQLPLLKNLTTDLLSRQPRHHKEKKDIFNELLRIAVISIAKAEWGLFRFIDVPSGNTVKEFFHAPGQTMNLEIPIGNRQLLIAQGQKGQIKTAEKFNFICTADEQAAIRCYFIFSPVKKNLTSSLSVLQSIVDQVQLFHRYCSSSVSEIRRDKNDLTGMTNIPILGIGL